METCCGRRRPPTRHGAAMERSDAVINLAGASIAGRRWTPERKREIRASRMEPTQALVSAIAAASRAPAVFVSASAVGFYGVQRDAHRTVAVRRRLSRLLVPRLGARGRERRRGLASCCCEPVWCWRVKAARSRRSRCPSFLRRGTGRNRKAMHVVDQLADWLDWCSGRSPGITCPARSI